MTGVQTCALPICNAVNWWANAKPYRPEGHVPIQGAIIVFSNWPVGHVAYVEAVNPDGSFVISEMNYFGVPGGGWGRVDRRTLTLDTPDILGFIY